MQLPIYIARLFRDKINNSVFLSSVHFSFLFVCIGSYEHKKYVKANHFLTKIKKKKI